MATDLLTSLDVDVIKSFFSRQITWGDANYGGRTSAFCVREALLRLPGNGNQQESAGEGATDVPMSSIQKGKLTQE